MSMKSIYVPVADEPAWDEAERLADSRDKSLSKLVSGLVKEYVEANRPGRDLGLPIGFAVPASMKDPRILRAEALADDIRERVLQSLLDNIRQEAS